jgi:hypothetical protein
VGVGVCDCDIDRGLLGDLQMILAFVLSMPNKGSWDGKWTSESKYFAKALSVSKKEADKVLEKPYYFYNFGDGWSARISVEVVTPSQKRTIQKKSAGFCGYDWMIDSIIEHGDIRVEKKEIWHSFTNEGCVK